MKSAPLKNGMVFVANGIIYFALYLAFTNNTGFREIIAGIVVAVISTVGTLIFSSAGKVRFRFRMRDIFQGWRMPWYALDGTVEVLQGLGKQIFKRRGAASFLAATPFAFGKHSLVDAGRRALEVTYTTATPNFIVIGIIEEQKLLLYHQIVPGKILTMTRKLGARS